MKQNVHLSQKLININISIRIYFNGNRFEEDNNLSFEERMERDQSQRRMRQLELQKESEAKLKKDYQFTPKISKKSQYYYKI